MKNTTELTALEIIRRGSHVCRWHTHPYPDSPAQTVGHHTFNVLGIIMTLHPSPSFALLQAALWHDVPEAECGDVPRPTRRKFPELDRGLESAELSVLHRYGIHPEGLTELEKDWLSFADSFEGLCYCLEQLLHGNQGWFPTYQSYDRTLGLHPFLSTKSGLSGETLGRVGEAVAKVRTEFGDYVR